MKSSKTYIYIYIDIYLVIKNKAAEEKPHKQAEQKARRKTRKQASE